LSYRDWTPEEIKQVVELRRDGVGWGQLAKQFNVNKEKIRAVFRRAVGAKQSGYKSLNPIRFTENSPVVAVLDIETLPMIVYS